MKQSYHHQPYHIYFVTLLGILKGDRTWNSADRNCINHLLLAMRVLGLI